MSSLGAWLVQRSVASWDWLLVLAESWVGALSWWSRLWEAIAATPPCLYAFIIWHSLFIDHNELPTLHGKLPLKLCNLKISLSLAVTETVSYSTLCAFIVVHILFLVIYYLLVSDSPCYFCSQCPAIGQALWKRCSGHSQVVQCETADKQSQN